MQRDFTFQVIFSYPPPPSLLKLPNKRPLYDVIVRQEAFIWEGACYTVSQYEQFCFTFS